MEGRKSTYVDGSEPRFGNSKSFCIQPVSDRNFPSQAHQIICASVFVPDGRLRAARVVTVSLERARSGKDG